MKTILVVGVALLMLGIFVSILTGNLMSEVQSAEHSYDPIHYYEQPYHDTVVLYEQGLDDIGDAAYPFGMIGIVALSIGAILIGVSFIIYSSDRKRMVEGQYKDDGKICRNIH